MKKFIAIILVVAAVAAVCLVSCNKDGNSGNNGTATGDVSGDIVTMINNATTADPENFAVRAPYQDYITAEQAPQFLGLTEEEFTANIESGIFYESMIMPSNQSYCLLKVKDGVKAADIQKKVFDNCNPRKWVCMSAEYVTVLADDSYVFLAMGPKSSCENLKAEFTKLAGDDMTAAMEKAVEEEMLPEDDLWGDDMIDDGAIVDDSTITEDVSGEGTVVETVPEVSGDEVSGDVDVSGDTEVQPAA